MSDEGTGDPVGERAYRRGSRDKGNKREDWAIDVFREVFGSGLRGTPRDHEPYGATAMKSEWRSGKGCL